LEQVQERSSNAARTNQLVTEYNVLCCSAFYKHNTIDDLVQDNKAILSLVGLPRRLYYKAVPVPKEATQHDAQPSTRSCLSDASKETLKLTLPVLNFSGKSEMVVTLPSLR